MNDAGDARRHERFAIRVPLYVSLPGDVYRKMVRHESRDVSADGLCFETTRRIPMDAESRLVISRLGDLPEPVLIYGRVIWRQRLAEGDRYRVGIKFTDFANITPEQLGEKIESWRPGLKA